MSHDGEERGGCKVWPPRGRKRGGLSHFNRRSKILAHINTFFSFHFGFQLQCQSTFRFSSSVISLFIVRHLPMPRNTALDAFVPYWFSGRKT